MRIEAQTELIASRPDVWALVAEPRHLADWWPGYTSIRPDRRGLAEGARWHVVRGGSIGLLRRPESQGLVVITAVEPDHRFSWHDVEQSFDSELRLEPAADGLTRAILSVDSPGWRAVFEGLRPLPRQALARLHDLCQTAASL